MIGELPEISELREQVVELRHLVYNLLEFQTTLVGELRGLAGKLGPGLAKNAIGAICGKYEQRLREFWTAELERKKAAISAASAVEAVRQSPDGSGTQSSLPETAPGASARGATEL